MKAAYPYIDDFVPAGTLASLEVLGELLAGARLRGGLAGRAVTAATSVSPSAGLAASAPHASPPNAIDADRRRPVGRPPAPPEDLTDEGTARDPRWLAEGWRGRRAGDRRAHVRQRAAPRRAVLLVADDGRIAGSVSGGCVEGAAAEEIAKARDRRPSPRHPLRHQRRAGVGRRAGVRRHDRRARRASGAGGRGRCGTCQCDGTWRRACGRDPPAGRRSARELRRPRARGRGGGGRAGGDRCGRDV